MRRLAGLAAAGAMVLSACTPATRPTGEVVGPAVDLGRGRLELAASLQSFDRCGEVLDYFRDSATAMGASFAFGASGGADTVTLGGFAGQERAAMTAGEASADGGGDTAAAAPGTTPQAGVDFSETNVQEVGVDEPDIVKTDGRVIVAVARNTLYVIDATGDAPVLQGSLLLGDANSHGGEVFLSGDRVLLLANGWREDQVAPSREGGPDIAYFGGQSVAILSTIDISDPEAPALENRIELDGEYVTARLVDGSARIVLRSAPQFQIQPLPGAETEAQFQRQVRAAVANTEIDDWLPSVRTDDGDDQPLVPCDAVSRPPEPSGVGTVTVLTIDTRNQLDIAHTATVVADVGTVYASQESLYIATNGWTDPRILERQAQAEQGQAAESQLPFFTTELHKFDISDPTTTSYAASGRVRGHLLNQWSLSEHDGHLRAATTELPQWFPSPGGEGQQSESFVSVFRQDGDALDQVGQVGELGLDERIFAVRYFGPTGYVVTFRQTDPLYVLDLSDPAAPRVTGELKILGYSAYLHPVGDGLLLGVGQDATVEGRTLGTQLSLFDVSDPGNPERIHQTSLGGANSAVEFDHRAFLWWPAEQLTVLPVQIYGSDGPVTREEQTLVEPGDPGEPTDDAIASSPPPPQDFFAGAVGFTVSRDPSGGFVERGRLTHAARNSSEPYAASVMRSLVIGDSLYTFSEVGLLASDLASFADRGWVSF